MRFHIKSIMAVFVVLCACYLLYTLAQSKNENRNASQRSKENIIGIDSGFNDDVRELPPIQAGPSYNSKAIPIVIASDKVTLPGAIATINSIVQHTNHSVKFYLATSHQSYDHYRAWLANTKLRNVQRLIRIFNEDLVKGKIKVRGGREVLGSPMNYARYFAPQLFPEIRGRMVYIDDDIIVQGDIAELYNTDLGEGHLAAFAEDCHSTSKRFSFYPTTYSSYVNFRNAHVKALNIDPEACSFNTGVYVADVAAWKRENITAELVRWMELNTREDIYGNQKGGGGSQPPMMIVFYNRYSTLDPLWHVRSLGLSAGTRYSSEFVHNAKLLHWSGPHKPWERVAAFQEIWDKYFIPDPSKKFKLLRRKSS
ncbi:PREDICTED: glycosyltransferase 8 domain-containing protein 1-like [Priapulus caudatus]|uniref:Glycosyltransferase 8 domain-containing protein 1-like n=1 Tax=Priapulus caudatus TaxID=37621 RepID=A0ABM1DPC7_PRICU|nr:PREDICTED: glycosyltransferase 8 domain-containing protein 1-like [Priapulus caudatus]